MSNAQKFSGKIGGWIQKHNTEKTEKDMKIIRYGLEILYLNIVKFVVLFTIAYFLKILPYTLVAAFAFTIGRIFAFGMHAKTTWGCYLATGSVYLLIPYLMLEFSLGIVVRIALSVLIMLGIWLYGPADTEQRPILGAKKRFKFKIKALLLIGLLIIGSYFMPVIYGDIVILSLIGEVIMILPITYKIFSRGYNNYENYESNF